MANHWILKTEPSDYAFPQLLRDGTTAWSGVRNAQALIHLRAMAKDDRALIYHTGGEKALVGLARIASAPYPDPKGDDPRFVAVDVAAERALPRAVPLAAIKADPALAELGLVRHSRLSVVPASAAQWKRLTAMAGL